VAEIRAVGGMSGLLVDRRGILSPARPGR